MYPPKAATIITQIGLTPISHIRRADKIGTQQLTNEMWALLANEKVGTAIRATTAGRMPANMAATTLLSSN